MASLGGRYRTKSRSPRGQDTIECSGSWRSR
jgi:hypothetical protein